MLDVAVRDVVVVDDDDRDHDHDRDDDGDESVEAVAMTRDSNARDATSVERMPTTVNAVPTTMRAPSNAPATRDRDGARARWRRARRRTGISRAVVAIVACAVGRWTTVDAKPRLEIVNSGHDIAHVSHILCGLGDAGKRKCHDYAEMLTPYEDSATMLERAFAELARRYSECPTGKDGGDLGYFPRGEMARDFEKVVFNSQTPLEEVVGPVETRNGWHMMLIHHRHLADEEAKEKARMKTEELRKERMERAAKQKEYQEERAKRRSERKAKKIVERDADRHSLHAHHDEL